MITIPQPQPGIIPLCERPAWKALQRMLLLVLGTGLGSALIVDGSSNRWNWHTCLTERDEPLRTT